MNNEIKPSDILVHAQELLGNEGQRWIKGDLRRRKVKRILGLPIGVEYGYCSLGAVRTAAENANAKWGPAHCSAEGYLAQAAPDLVPRFNDHSSTTFHHVKQVFCAATKAALEQEEKELRNGNK